MKHKKFAFTLILIGSFLLLYNLGLFSWQYIGSLLKLWPFLLITAGLDLIFKHTRIGHLGSYLAWALIICLLSLGALSQLYLPADSSWQWGPFTVQRTGFYLGTGQATAQTQVSRHFELPSQATSYQAKIEFGAGKLYLGSNLDDPEHLLEANLRVPANSDPIFDLIQDTNTKIEIKNPLTTSWVFGQHSQSWQLDFTPSFPARFTIQTGASDNQLDFSGLQLQELNLDTGASNSEITFGLHQSNIKCTIKTGVSDLQINLPQGMEYQIKYEGGISRIQLPTGSTKSTTSFTEQSPDYQTAEHTLDLTINAGVSQIKISYYTPIQEILKPTPTIPKDSTELDFYSLRRGAQSPIPTESTSPSLIRLEPPSPTAETLSPLRLYDLSNPDKLYLLALLGQKSTGGYRIQIQSAFLADGKLILQAEVITPEEDEMVTEAITTPFDLIALDTDDLPPLPDLLIELIDQDGKLLASLELEQ